MKDIIIGQIMRNKKIMGTGFLVAPDIFMTVKHNVIVAEDLVEEVLEEKEVIVQMKGNDCVEGVTINLLEAVNKNIDCVLIKLNEVLTDKEVDILLNAGNSIKGFTCDIMGFPKLVEGEFELSGKLNSDGDGNFLIHVEKENQLQNYEGFSGAPVMVLDRVVAIVTKQQNCDILEALSIDYVTKVLDCKEIKVVNRDIPASLSEGTFSLDEMKTKMEQMISVAGPRYNNSLNIKTSTHNELIFWLGKDSIKNKYTIIADKIADCIQKLNKFDDYNRNDRDLVLDENREKIVEIICYLQEERIIFIDMKVNHENIQQIIERFKVYSEKLSAIFANEKDRFEHKHGEGTYGNRSWRGYMASYMCVFPAQYLDELDDGIKILEETNRLLNLNNLEYLDKQAALLIGKGGIGKTHLLCDIINDYVDREIPAILLYGDMFHSNKLIDTIIMDNYFTKENFDTLLSWLNEYGDRYNAYIPICIDAINETTDVDYWNVNLPFFLAKIQNYRNIKLIISCRSIYLEEYLDNEKIHNIVKVSHRGFEQLEEMALSIFCQYYGVNIDYETTTIPEFLNPLFLKMLCEIAQSNDDKTVIVDDIQTLMNHFFDIKNKIISKQFLEHFSVRDKVVNLVLQNITEYMSDNDLYSIEWKELRAIVSEVLEQFGIKEKTAGFIKLLISENLLREAEEKEVQISFSYQKFYEFLYSKKYIDRNIESIINAVETHKITLGTLEMIQIEYYKRNQVEFISKIGNRIHGEVVESFLSGLYWRGKNEIGQKTIQEIESLWKENDENDIRRTIFGLLAVSTKINCPVNAEYIHEKLSRMNNYSRDYFLSFFLLKQYDQVKIISDLCERAISLESMNFSEKNIYLWKIMLCWGCGLNDVKLRDKASKGLANLFKLYPSDMVKVLMLFRDVKDDYIHERLWQAIYSVLIILTNYQYTKVIMDYIDEFILVSNNWPQNVLIRDYIRNIYEYAYYNRWCDKKKIKEIRPPYKSPIHKIDEKWISKNKNVDSRLFWNCQDSDFVKYTIPSEVQDYGLTKEKVGMLIYEDIIKSGYCFSVIAQAEYDHYIDYTYGSLRNRDEQVERIGKKYQKIFLCREMGNIYDNYSYSPRYRYGDEVEIVVPEQGNTFRSIDLTILFKKNQFGSVDLCYPFYRYKKWKDRDWFKNNDVEKYIREVLSYQYNEEEYYTLQAYLSSREVDKKDYREVWMQIRMYLYDREKKTDLLKWFQKKDFEGRWMPEGYGQLYENCIGEYPWSPTMVNYLGQVEEQDFRQEKPAPCYLYTTVNDYTAEKDSPFCVNETASYMFPSKFLIDKMKLTWDGAYGYLANGKAVIFNGCNDTIFVNKDFLKDFLRRNKLDMVWTILGEKQKITGGFGDDFPGRGEFSFTFYISEEGQIIMNHKVYNVL